MPKRYDEMSVAQLDAEIEAWDRIVICPKGPGTPSNTAREGAQRLYTEACAWRARRIAEQ